MQQCNAMEQAFAFCLGSGIAKTATEAARLAGYGEGSKLPGVHKRTGYNVVHRPRVIAAIEEVCRAQFRGLVPHVIAAAKELITDKKHPDHAKTVISLLSKLGYGDRSQVDVRVSGEVQVNHVDAAVEDLARLKALGVPHEKLIEVFGFSGLERYEQLLLERKSKMKVIEHVPAGEPDPAGSSSVPRQDEAIMEPAP